MLVSFRSLWALSISDARLAHILKFSNWTSLVELAEPLFWANKGLRIRMRKKLTHYRHNRRLATTGRLRMLSTVINESYG